MRPLTAIEDYTESLAACSTDALWALFDGDRACMNLAHECLDRHRGRGPAVSIKFADGNLEHYDFEQLAGASSRVAHWLTRRGIGAGDRVALEARNQDGELSARATASAELFAP